MFGRCHDSRGRLPACRLAPDGAGPGFFAVVCALGVALAGAPVRAAEAPPALQDLEATRSRPLFVPSRRAPPVAPAVVPLAAPPLAQAPQAPRLQLSGVVIGPGRSFAILRREAGDKLLSLEVGREVDGWQVAAIRPREVELRNGERTAVYGLPPR